MLGDEAVADHFEQHVADQLGMNDGIIAIGSRHNARSVKLVLDPAREECSGRNAVCWSRASDSKVLHGSQQSRWQSRSLTYSLAVTGSEIVLLTCCP